MSAVINPARINSTARVATLRRTPSPRKSLKAFIWRGVSAYSSLKYFLFLLLTLCAIGFAQAAVNDFNGDSKSDLLLRDSASGNVELRLQNGFTTLASSTYAGLSDWEPTHVADFNADGKSDILWRRKSDGAVVMWLMDGIQSIGGGVILGGGTGWSVSHVADLNGDSKTDLIWRNTDGTVAVWLMNGTTLAQGAALLGANSVWSISHVADLNGDGKADFIWRHTDGTVAVWLMNGTTLAQGAALLGANSVWSISHAADLNGDGKADLIWKHVDGYVAVWLMDGVTPTLSALILGANSGWSISHVADLNGDGKADLIWKHVDGYVAVWLMDGVTPTLSALILGANSGWSVSHLADLNGDGKTDIIWRNSDGSIAAWLMSGTTALQSGLLVGAGTQSVVPNDSRGGVAPAVAELYFIHPDHLGTPRTITRAADNAKVWEWENTEAFGNNSPNENPAGNGVFAYNLRFPGQVFDKETGTNYNYFRDYDASVGRYVQSDPIGLLGGMASYGFVSGQPLVFIDAFGLCQTAIWRGGYIAGWKPCDDQPDPPPPPKPPRAQPITLPVELPPMIQPDTFCYPATPVFPPSTDQACFAKCKLAGGTSNLLGFGIKEASVHAGTHALHSAGRISAATASRANGAMLAIGLFSLGEKFRETGAMCRQACQE